MQTPIRSCEAILFDLDGTLVEVNERFFLAFNRTLASCGKLTLGWEQFLADVRNDELTRYMPEEHESGEKFLWTLLEHFNNAGREVIVRGIPGVRDALEILQSRGYRMGVVTGRRTKPEYVQRELDEIGFLGYFDHVCTRVDGYGADCSEVSEVMEILSKRMIIHLASNRMGVPVESCVFVGDWTGDIQSARQAGVGFIVAVLSGGLEEDVLRKKDPHLILPSVADLPVHLL